MTYECGTNLPAIGAVTGYPLLTGPAYDPVIVGAPPQWGDASDATYVDLQTIGTSASSTKQTYAVSQLASDATLADLDPTQVEVSFVMRYKATTTSTAPLAIGLAIVPTPSSGGPGFAFGGFLGTPLVVDDTINTATLLVSQDDLDGNGISMADLLGMLAAGQYARLRINQSSTGPGTRNARIYEFSAHVGHPCPTPAAVAAPWLRQHPRSPLRHWPPERSPQRSIRRAGGYL